MKPDDITDEEYDAGVRGLIPLRRALAAQNALRDRRVRAEVIEEIARELDKAREHLRPRNEYDEGPLAMQMAYAGAVVEQLAERVRAMTTKGDTDA